jgi:GLPGLI family protein
MKKIITIVALVASTACFAQKGSFQGKIAYEISYPGTELDANTMAMLPKEMTMYIKNDKARTEMQMGAMGSSVSIVDNKAKTTTSLMDMMGQKIAIKSTAEDVEKAKDKNPEPKVTLLGETKEIAGYKCKKAEIEMQDAEKSKVVVYYTDELGSKGNNWNNPQFKGIDGFLMEYEMVKQGMRMKMSTKSVSKEDVDDSKFTIPSGYQEMTQEQMMKAMTGGK